MINRGSKNNKNKKSETVRIKTNTHTKRTKRGKTRVTVKLGAKYLRQVSGT